MDQNSAGGLNTVCRRRILLSAYFTLVLLPALILVLTGGMNGVVPFHGAARFFAVTGFALLMLQPVLSARFHWIEGPFGLDRVLAFHRLTGVTAAISAVLHPVMLALGSESTALFTSLNSPWQIYAGRIALAVLLLYGAAAVYRASLRIPFQLWFRMHNALTPLILAAVFLHSWFTALRYMDPFLKATWYAFSIVSLYSYLHLTVYQRLRARFNPWLVREVNPVADRVWEIVLVPPRGKPVFSYYPGQFLFITLRGGRDLPVEEHPFTIASSPGDGDSISIAVKESGDFTGAIGKTEPGDRASVLAPYGRFSHLLKPLRRNLVFIAGGIGITPMISMLRYIQKSGDMKGVRLFHACRTEGDIAFRNELDSMKEAGLQTVHILSRPHENWTGERGRLSGEILERYMGSMTDTSFFVCGPPPMMNGVAAVLLLKGVAAENIHMEKFTL